MATTTNTTQTLADSHKAETAARRTAARLDNLMDEIGDWEEVTGYALEGELAEARRCATSAAKIRKAAAAAAKLAAQLEQLAAIADLAK